MFTIIKNIIKTIKLLHLPKILKSFFMLLTLDFVVNLLLSLDLTFFKLL